MRDLRAICRRDSITEQEFRWTINTSGLFDNDEIMREARQVRARAEGRVETTVENFFRVRLADGRYSSDNADGFATANVREAREIQACHGTAADQCAARYPGAAVVNVTLTRRRILRKAPAS